MEKSSIIGNGFIVGLLILFSAATLISIGVFIKEASKGPSRMKLETAISPGDLSRAHAFLETDCAACHTASKGVDSAKCMICHANDKQLVTQQNTAFHAELKNCSVCHLEHQGLDKRPIQMNHQKLATLGLQLIADEKTSREHMVGKQLEQWIKNERRAMLLSGTHHGLTAEEKTLNCAVCHANQDVHRKLFGSDCASCHTTDTWNVAEFVHPSLKSENCASCHQAPPSHFMMHFKMISTSVAKQHHAKVGECYVCHQTNDWNDIKGAGWYKHH